jgi:hypothetical protein
MAGNHTEAAAIAPSSKSKKKNKKKKGGPVKAEANGEAAARNGVKSTQDNEIEEAEEDVEPETVWQGLKGHYEPSLIYRTAGRTCRSRGGRRGRACTFSRLPATCIEIPQQEQWNSSKQQF